MRVHRRKEVALSAMPNPVRRSDRVSRQPEIDAEMQKPQRSHKRPRPTEALSGAMYRRSQRIRHTSARPHHVSGAFAGVRHNEIERQLREVDAHEATRRITCENLRGDEPAAISVDVLTHACVGLIIVNKPRFQSKPRAGSATSTHPELTVLGPQAAFSRTGSVPRDTRIGLPIPSTL